MTQDEMKTEALKRAKNAFPDGSEFRADKIYEHFMDGTLITVSFKNNAQKEEWIHFHFENDEVHFFRWSSDVFTTVANHKERNPFFRLLAVAGIGGVIALVLVVIFSILLSALAFKDGEATKSIIEVVKISFSTILGFFFGSQTTHRKH